MSITPPYYNVQAKEVKQTLLNFFFDSLSNDTKLYGFGWKNAKSAGLPTLDWLASLYTFMYTRI